MKICHEGLKRFYLSKGANITLMKNTSFEFNCIFFLLSSVFMLLEKDFL